MKKLIAIFFLATISNLPFASASSPESLTYGLHLFFNEQDNVDTLEIRRDSNGKLSGEMKVPRDFEASILNIQENENTLSFDLPVPKNQGRPKDLVFHYEARYFDSSKKQLAGFVTLKDEKDFVASFVAFARE